jgi:hypothetical protein
MDGATRVNAGLPYVYTGWVAKAAPDLPLKRMSIVLWILGIAKYVNLGDSLY